MSYKKLSFRLLRATSVAALLTACTTPQDYTDYLQRRYQNQHIDLVITRVGPPTSTAELSSGYLYEWRHSGAKRSSTSVQSNQFTGNSLQTTTTTDYCNHRFTTDPLKIVTQIAWDGNACYNKLESLPKD